MIAPILRTSFKGIFWLQGESDVNPSDTPGSIEPQRGGKYYACAISAMVSDWRSKFRSATGSQTDVPFMWVQLSPWVGHEAATSFYQLPAIRHAQLAVNALPQTGFASAVDLGDPNPDTNPWGGVHWRTKGPMGPRLGAVARALCYGNSSVQTLGPAAERAMKVSGGVLVSFTAASLGQGGLVYRPMLCPFFALNQTDNIKRCGWYDVIPPDGTPAPCQWLRPLSPSLDAHHPPAFCRYELESGGVWSNATASISEDAKTITVHGNGDYTGVRYLYADWPVATLYNTEGLPATPFVLPVSDTVMSV